ncbi:hypothetical protein PM082_021253 [Marasmius tenuissimus]|nr:hypothetical protein PM082_021253 [Marasmius tenuissimus]
MPSSSASTSPPPYSPVDPQRSRGAARNGHRGTSHRGDSWARSSRNQPDRNTNLHHHYHACNHQPVPNNTSVNVAVLNQETPLLFHSESQPLESPQSPSLFTRNRTYKLAIFLAGAFTYYLFQRYTYTHTTWINLTASPNCTSIGARTYTAHLVDKPEGFYPNKFCSDIPIIIHGRTIPHPVSCYSEPSQCQTYEHDGQPKTVTCTITRGEWLVDFDEGSCMPTWDPVNAGAQNPTPDDKCLSYKKRGYTAYMSPSRIPPGLDHLQSCLNTPATINHRSLLPEECRLEQSGVYGARFVAEEESSCTPTWVDVQREWRCERYNLKRFSGLMEEVQDLDGLEVCKEVAYNFFGMKEKTPDWCERESSGRIRGHWWIDFNVPECHPVLRDIRDYGCAETHIKRVEARVDDIGRGEDWYRMCTTTPLWWEGVEYYPIQCESRRILWNAWTVAVFNIHDPRCT